MSDIKVFTVTGEGITPYLSSLAQLRLKVFREFPYLYDGTLDYERKYLATYAKSPESLFVLAEDEGKIIGASTGVPMKDETDETKRPFLLNGFDPDRIFYYGESVLSAEYRGRGLGVRFFEERENYARTLRRFEIVTFCAVDREKEDPRRPQGYVFLDDFWVRRGFSKHPELKTQYTWKELGESCETPKSMTCWIKRIVA